MSDVGPDPARAVIDARVLAWIREADARPEETRFDALALELFAFQFAHCAPYARFCRGRGRTPSNVRSWREIPAVPTGAFKEVPLRSFPARRTVHCFRTSGTSTERPGTLHLDTLEIYEASALASFRRFVLPDLTALGGHLRIRVLAPTPEEAPHSSLSHMFGCVARRFGSGESGFDLVGGRLDATGCLAALERAASASEPVLVCGTAFAFVHLLDALEARATRLSLPSGSRLFETGGFKGRAREMPRDALYTALEAALGVPRERIVNQYGMTELASQFHDSVLAFPSAPRRKLGPPWARARIVDPETSEDATPGATGVVHLVDLANTGSVIAVATADLGRARDDGFEVLGRRAGAEARGCSIAADAMLERTPA